MARKIFILETMANVRGDGERDADAGKRDALPPPCLFSLQGVPARACSSSSFVCSSREGTTRRGKRHFVCECNVALHCSSRQTDRGKEGRRAGITFPQCEAVEDGASFYTISWLRLTLKKALCCVRSDIIHWQEWKQTRIGMRKSKLDLHSG